MKNKNIILIVIIVLVVGVSGVFTWQYFVKPVEDLVVEELVTEEPVIKEPITEYPVRWTKYVAIDDLAEIYSLYDESVYNLNAIYSPPIDKGLSLVNDVGKRVFVDTCREYLCAVDQGFYARIRMDRNHEMNYFEFPCLYLQFFKSAKNSEISYLSDFKLKDRWQELPFIEVFNLDQKTCLACNIEEVLNSQIIEASEIYIKGENPDIVHGRGFHFSFEIYILGWGDFNDDGLEDILLYKKIKDVLWGYDSGSFLIISKLDKNASMVAIERFSAEDERKKPSPNLCEFFKEDQEIYENKKYGFKFKIPPFFVENGYKIVLEEKQYPWLARIIFKTKSLNPDRLNRYFSMKYFQFIFYGKVIFFMIILAH